MQNDNPTKPEELYRRYLEKHPGHVEDLIYVLSVDKEQNIRIPKERIES